MIVCMGAAQNRFWEWDKAVDFNVGQNRPLCKREQTAIKIVSLKNMSWPNYR